MKKKPKYESAFRCSVAFKDDWVWPIIRRAMCGCRAAGDFESLTTHERCDFIRRCVEIVCRALVRQGCRFPMPAACDIRYESKAETEERMQAMEPGQAALPITTPTALPPAAPVLDLAWLKEHFPERWS